ncbi:MAG TPA: hypothetical protein VFT70_12060 [Nocardioides sp.]|nr:hypothetical protein [Nocardioides sp.]
MEETRLPSLSPEAIFDSLYVVRFSTPKGYAITTGEVTYFCYLACLLSVYEGKPADEWGYQFAATKTISPYSASLAQSIGALAAGGRLDASGQGYVSNDLADADYQIFSAQSLFAGRSRYLRAACNSSLMIPLPAVGAALNNEPTLQRALSISASRELLSDESGPQGLHRHFERLAEELPDRSDLFVAAVTWISELASIDDHGDAEESTSSADQDVASEVSGEL